MNNPLPMLITGLPGIPGYNSWHYFRKKYGEGVIGIKPAHTLDLDYPGVYGINAEDTQSLGELFDKYRFKTVIDASGCCALKSCEHNPALADKINTLQGAAISSYTSQFGSTLIRFSTDLVFDGVGEGGYTEEDEISPITVYGKTMARAEVKILEEHPEAAIFRIPLPMGPSLNGHAGAVDWIENRFKKNNPATLYFDEVRNNPYIQDVLSVLEYWLENFTPGIFHLGGPLPLTLFQIAQIVNKLGNFDPGLLKGSPRSEDTSIVPRVGNVSMDISKIEKILPVGTLKPWPLNPSYIPTDNHWHADRSEVFAEGAVQAELYGYDLSGSPGNPLHWYQKPSYLEGSVRKALQEI